MRSYQYNFLDELMVDNFAGNGQLFKVGANRENREQRLSRNGGSARPCELARTLHEEADKDDGVA